MLRSTTVYALVADFLLLIPTVSSVACHVVLAAHVTREPNLDDVIFPDGVIFDISVRSKLECVSTCLEMRSCASLTYRRTNTASSCRGYRRVMTSPSVRTPAVGAKAFIVRGRIAFPDPLGYKVNVQTGRCYKLHDVVSDYITARDTCAAEGAHLATLDTEEKLHLPFHGVDHMTSFVTPYILYPYYIGASRPMTEWDTEWSETDHFTWDQTGQSLQPLDHYFVEGTPRFTPNLNCVALLYGNALELLHAVDCGIKLRFICEREG